MTPPIEPWDVPIYSRGAERDLVGRASNQIIGALLGPTQGMGFFTHETPTSTRSGNPLAFNGGSKLTPRMAKAKQVSRTKNKAARKARKKSS